MAALSRMANSTHRKVSIVPSDTIIFSSSPIPGNEKNISKIMNELALKGAQIVFEDTHVSGHACREELRLIYALTKPKYAIPVHGEYRHLMRHRELAIEMGIPRRMHLYWQKVMFWSSIRDKERSLEKYRQEESSLMDLVSEMLVTSY